LAASTSYDVRATYIDADGVIGTNPQTISGVVTSAAAPLNSTTAGTASVAPGSVSIQVTAPYTNDANANNTLKVEWGTGGTYTLGTQTLTHVASPYAYTINGLTASTAYNVRVTYQDADTVTGSAVQTFTPTTLAFSSPLMHTAANVNPGDTKGYGATWGSTFTCATCHVDGSSNVKIVSSTVDTPNGPRSVVFTRMTATSDALNGVFGNDARTYAGNGTGGSTNICEVCHRKTTFHRYSTNAPTLSHYNNRLCLPCHPHSAGFKGSGHTVPMYATAAGHTGCASGIGCHANTNPAAPYPTAGTAPDCRSCHTKGDPTTANIGCGSCHGAANGNGEPVGTVHPDNAGSHAAHTSIPTACTYCHDTGGTGGNADHGKGNRGANPAIVNLAASFTWNGTSCSTASCHANVYGAGTVASPTWGTAAGCTACHSVAIGATGPATGSHPAHTTAVCTDCHAAGTTATSAPSTGHADGNVDVLDGYPANVAKHTAGTYTGTCTTASCHANVYGAGNTTSPVWGTAAGCTACHSVAIGATGPATGSHPAHTTAVCTDCHAAGTTATTAPSTGHADGNVDILDGYPTNVAKHAAGTYTGTCTTASCHANVYGAGNTTSPVWGTAAGCTACHSVAIGATGPATGSHAAHTTAVCTDCHAAGTTATTAPSTGHADGNVDVLDGYPANVAKHASGTYTGTCTTASCHSNVYGAGNTTSPVWGTAAGCTACHSVAIGATGPATGSHAAHTTAVCTDCHAAGTTATTAPSTGHANGNIDVLDGYPTNVAKHAAGTYTGTCTTASCHSNVYGAGNTTTPVWGTAAGCTACHSVAIGVNGPATGSHDAHVGSLCTACHAAGTTQTTSPTTGHADGNIDVLNGYPANVAKHAAGTYTGTCSSASCHVSAYGAGNTTSPVWGTAGGCGSCHPIDVTGAPATGSHAPHLAYTTLVNCGSCHAGAVKDTSGGSAHTDGNIDVINGYPANVAKHAAGTYTGNCANTYCHSNGTSVATAAIPANTSPTWGVASGCTVCHSFPPAYANNTPKKNSHSAGGHSITCDNCHYNTTTNGTTVTTVANHVNSAYNVNPNTSKGIAFTYTFATGGGTCATVSCHGTAQWGVTVMDCVSCHTSAVNITKGPLAGQSLQRRAIQPEFLATWSHKNSDNHNVYKQDCIVCHMEGNKATGGTSSVHGDGYINLRDADTGVEITNVTWNGGTPGAFVTASGNASFSRFSRNLTVTMEADPAFLTLAAIEVNHCLSCHDADGAMHADAQVPTTGTAGRPFGVAVGATSTDAWTVAAGNTTSNVVNVASSFDTANASYHPVLGKANNGYAGGTKMKAPWNGTLTPAKPGAGSTTVYGFLISCWDCHADVDTGTITDSVTAHGNGTTIRANVGIAHPNLCTKCHADTYGTTSGQHGTGSALTTGNGNIGSNIYTCQNCHSAGSAYNIRPWRGVDAHGFNVFAQVRSNTAGAAAGAATWTSGAKPWAFIRTNNLSGWRPARGTGLTDATTGTCGPNGVSPCSNSHGTYTPGGYY
jgi:predicted CxxxxCH...CXXCH cytochrome family protein